MQFKLDIATLKEQYNVKLQDFWIVVFAKKICICHDANFNLKSHYPIELLYFQYMYKNRFWN